MRSRSLVLAALAALMLVGCDNRSRQDRPAAREVGREAYKFNQEAKKAAKELGHDLRQAGREMRQGWNDAKHEDPGRPRR